MWIPKIPPIGRMDHFGLRDRRFVWNLKQGGGSKITGFALACLSKVRCGRLFPFSAAGMVAGVVFFKKHLSFEWQAQRQREGFPSFVQKEKTRYRLGTPFGLKASSFGWINAWAQFLLYLPKFVEIISFAEKSLSPFVDFVEQYAWDQKEGRALSLADSASLARCLTEHNLSMDGANFYTLCLSFFQSMFPVRRGLGCFFQDSVVLHPEWIWRQVEENLSEIPIELVVAENPNMSGQFRLQGKYLYDLDLLIERRASGEKIHFITYVRVDGAWYQCEDEKVRWISSRTLSAPMSRGVLFHYKRAMY